MRKRIGNLIFDPPQASEMPRGTLVILCDTGSGKGSFALGIVNVNFGHKLRITVIEPDGSGFEPGQTVYYHDDEEDLVLLPARKTHFELLGDHQLFMHDGELYERTGPSVGMTFIDESVRTTFTAWDTVHSLKPEHVSKNQTT